MLHNIPLELQRLPQWVVADMTINPENGKPFKTPLNPRNGAKADVTDPATWGTFAEARSTGAKCIGFVLSPADPYSIIDLDAPSSSEMAERHTTVLEASSSYAEYSQSRNGVHIIVRGVVPHGCRRDCIEVYSQARYMICTGDVLRQAPIKDEQGLLNTLFAEIVAGQQTMVELEELPEQESDKEVAAMATNAANSAKLKRLVAGEWEGEWPSQSEADFALMAMLAFYSRSNEQCRRLFRESALGQRDKAMRNDKYLNRMLMKIRAHEPATPDISAIIKQANEIAEGIKTPQPPRQGPPPVPRTPEQTSPQRLPSQGTRKGPPPIITRGPVRYIDETKGGGGNVGSKVSYPPGFVGDLARYFKASAIRPVDEIAIAAALALAAGTLGRSYNISNTGLNQYLILLARTGSGKEGAANGIDAMVAAARMTVPMADQFVGPGAFASGQAFVRVLDTKPCFVSVLGEFGITLEQICDPRAPEAKSMLRKVMLDVYGKSGFTQVLRPSVYSDTLKNTALVQAPCVTLLGESTPEEFYGKLDSSYILSGLVPRFSIIEYDGPRPGRNPNAFMPPPEELVSHYADLATIALTCKANNSCQPVSTNAEAARLLTDFDIHADRQINQNEEVERHLWNRAHLKVLKLAALLAVGCNPHMPIVSVADVEWAIRFVEADVQSMLARFTEGDIGRGENKQESDLKHAIRDYIHMSVTTRKNYKVPDKLLTGNLIPYHYLRRRLRNVASFANDRRGPGDALEALLEKLVLADAMVQLPRAEAKDVYGVTSPIYTVGATF